MAGLYWKCGPPLMMVKAWPAKFKVGGHDIAGFDQAAFGISRDTRDARIEEEQV